LTQKSFDAKIGAWGVGANKKIGAKFYGKKARWRKGVRKMARCRSAKKMARAHLLLLHRHKRGVIIMKGRYSIVKRIKSSIPPVLSHAHFLFQQRFSYLTAY